ncbi:hypothetical protein G7046_g4972 [Stylonectria norvegica]|nr:hypothetical protein G7046_g4972 [Stylonectria norvegica]
MSSSHEPRRVAEIMLSWLNLNLVSCTELESLWAGYGHICAIKASAPDDEVAARVRHLCGGPIKGASDTFHLILKLIAPPAQSGDEGHLRKMLSYEVEQCFYEEITPGLRSDVAVAQCLASTRNMQGKASSETLRGLTATLMTDLRPAFPVAGGKRLALSPDQIHAAVEWLAKFHSDSWKLLPDTLSNFLLPPLEEAQRRKHSPSDGGRKLWLNGGYTYLATRRQEYNSLAQDRSSEWCEAFCKVSPGSTLSVADDVADFLTPKGRPFETYIHGDVKSENLFTTKTGDEVAFFDFQYAGLGLGVCDLAKLFTCSVPLNMITHGEQLPKLARMNEGERVLLERYRKVLLENRPPEKQHFDYKWEDLVRHWETALVDWCRFQQSWGSWGNTEWLTARADDIRVSPNMPASAKNVKPSTKQQEKKPRVTWTVALDNDLTPEVLPALSAAPAIVALSNPQRMTEDATQIMRNDTSIPHTADAPVKDASGGKEKRGWLPPNTVLYASSNMLSAYDVFVAIATSTALVIRAADLGTNNTSSIDKEVRPVIKDTDIDIVEGDTYAIPIPNYSNARAFNNAYTPSRTGSRPEYNDLGRQPRPINKATLADYSHPEGLFDPILRQRLLQGGRKDNWRLTHSPPTPTPTPNFSGANHGETSLEQRLITDGTGDEKIYNDVKKLRDIVLDLVRAQNGFQAQIDRLDTKIGDGMDDHINKAYAKIEEMLHEDRAVDKMEDVRHAAVIMEDVYRKWLDATNERKWEDALQYLAAELTIDGHQLTNKEYLLQVQSALEAAPDRRTELDTFIADTSADKAAARLIHGATFIKPYNGVKVTGESTEWTEHALYTFVEDKIAHITSLVDLDSARENKRQVTRTPHLKRKQPLQEIDLAAAYRRYIAAINDHEMAEIFPTYCHPELIHNMRRLSLEQYWRFIEGSFEEIQGLSFTIREIIVDKASQQLAARLEFTGKPVKEFMGIQPTGKEVKFWEHVYYTFDDGKMSFHDKTKPPPLVAALERCSQSLQEFPHLHILDDPKDNIFHQHLVRNVTSYKETHGQQHSRQLAVASDAASKEASRGSAEGSPGADFEDGGTVGGSASQSNANKAKNHIDQATRLTNVAIPESGRQLEPRRDGNAARTSSEHTCITVKRTPILFQGQNAASNIDTQAVTATGIPHVPYGLSGVEALPHQEIEMAMRSLRGDKKLGLWDLRICLAIMPQPEGWFVFDPAFDFVPNQKKHNLPCNLILLREVQSYWNVVHLDEERRSVTLYDSRPCITPERTESLRKQIVDWIYSETIWPYETGNKGSFNKKLYPRVTTVTGSGSPLGPRCTVIPTTHYESGIVALAVIECLLKGEKIPSVVHNYECRDRYATWWKERMPLSDVWKGALSINKTFEGLFLKKSTPDSNLNSNSDSKLCATNLASTASSSGNLTHSKKMASTEAEGESKGSTSNPEIRHERSIPNTLTVSANRQLPGPAAVDGNTHRRKSGITLNTLKSLMRQIMERKEEAASDATQDQKALVQHNEHIKAQVDELKTKIGERDLHKAELERKVAELEADSADITVVDGCLAAIASIENADMASKFDSAIRTVLDEVMKKEEHLKIQLRKDWTDQTFMDSRVRHLERELSESETKRKELERMARESQDELDAVLKELQEAGFCP